MAAYIIAENLAIKDPEAFNEYRAGVAATVAKYGGKFLVRGGAVHPMEGDWKPGFVIIEFENAEKARAWHDSAEYAPLIALRQRTADTRMTLVEGV